MKRFTIFALLAIMAALAMAEWVGRDAGYILVNLGDLTVEMTFWTGLAVFLLAFVVFYYLARALLLVNRGVERLVKPQPAGLPARMDRSSRAVSHFVAGDWRRAERHLLRAARKSETPLVNYLLAARASTESGARDRAEHYLSEAAEQGRAADMPVKLTRAELQLQGGDAVAALASLDTLAGRGAANPVALRLRVEALRSLQDWQSLLGQLPRARKRQVLPAARLDELEMEAGLAILDEAAAAPGLEALQQAWQLLPTGLQRDPSLLERYCSLLATSDAGQEAEKLLRTALKRQWDENLVRLYGVVCGDDLHRQLTVAETWLREHPEDPALLLTLGRLSLRNRLWGKARDYLEASVERDARPDSCAELGRLYEHLGEHARSRLVFQRGLLRSTTTLPALPMPD